VTTRTIDPCGVYFIDDLADVFHTSRRTIQRRRAHGVFPIPELDSIDNRPRWSGAEILKYLERQNQAPARRSWRKAS
jgi:hypothetical protein